MEALRDRLTHNALVVRMRELQRRLPHELEARETRLASEDSAATKKNTRQRIQRQRHKDKVEKKRLLNPRAVARHRNDPPQPHSTKWEIEERWEDAREEVGGLLPGDWCYATGERDYSYAHRCLTWLAHTDLHEFLSPLPSDRQDEDKRTHIDVLLSNHAAAICAHLRRTLEAADHERSIEEKAVAVMVAGLVGMWSQESLEALRESKLVAQLVAIASAKSDDDEDQETGRSRARALSHSKLSFDELRAAAIDVLGVVHFLGFLAAYGRDSQIDDELDAVLKATYMPLCAQTDSLSLVPSAALNAVGLLGTLWSPARQAVWIEENVELILVCLEDEAVPVRQATVDTLAVILASIDEQGFDSEDDEGYERAVIGQHDLYRLTTQVEPLAEAYRRRATPEESHLRRTADRLLRLMRRLEKEFNDEREGQVSGEDENEGEHEEEDDDDEDDEVPHMRLVLEDAAVDHDVTVYQPELIVSTEWHMKQLRSLQAVAGPSLAFYAQAELLVDLVRVMVEDNELVVGYRSPTERVGPPVSKDTRRHYNYKRVKGTNKSKHLQDLSFTKPIKQPKPAHPRSAKRLTWAESYVLRVRRGNADSTGLVGGAWRRRESDPAPAGPSIAENTNRDRDPRNVVPILERIDITAAQPRFVPMH